MSTSLGKQMLSASVVSVIVSAVVTSAVLTSAQDSVPSATTPALSDVVQPATTVTQPSQQGIEPPVIAAPPQSAPTGQTQLEGGCPPPTTKMFDDARAQYGKNVRFDPATCSVKPGPADPTRNSQETIPYPDQSRGGQQGNPLPMYPDPNAFRQQGSWGEADNQADWTQQAIQNGLRESRGPFCPIPNSTAWTGDRQKCAQWGSPMIGGQGQGQGPGDFSRGGFPMEHGGGPGMMGPPPFMMGGPGGMHMGPGMPMMSGPGRGGPSMGMPGGDHGMGMSMEMMDMGEILKWANRLSKKVLPASKFEKLEEEELAMLGQIVEETIARVETRRDAARSPKTIARLDKQLKNLQANADTIDGLLGDSAEDGGEDE